MVRTACILTILGLALLLASDAGAVGGVVGSSGEKVTVGQARYALAISPAQTTRWASIHVEKFPGAMAWLLPIRPGARVDEVSDAWFEALELATAPRIVPASCTSSPMARQPRVESLPDRVPTERSRESTVIDDTQALRAFAGEWALDLPTEIESRFEVLQARGFSLAAFLYAGPAGGGFTRTVRVTDDAFPNVPLFMTLGAKAPLGVTAFLIGGARARLGAGPEIEIDPASVTFTSDGSTNYETLRTERLLAASGQSWVVEASERELFLTGARRPGGLEITPPIAPTYDQRAASYGDPSGDLTLAMHGLDPGKVWVTRVAGILPADRFGDDIAVTMAAGPSKSPFLVTTQVPADCVPPIVMPPAEIAAIPSPVAVKPHPPEPHQDPLPEQGPVLVETTVIEAPPPQQVIVAGSCDGSPSSQPHESSDDSCSHSESTSDSSSADDGCDSSPDQPSEASDDGCDSSGSDTSQDEGGGCDGGSQDNGQSSDGCDSSSDSSSSSDARCSMSRRPRRGRSRTSLVAWGVCAVLLPLRRSMRRKSAARQC